MIISISFKSHDDTSTNRSQLLLSLSSQSPRLIGPILQMPRYLLLDPGYDAPIFHYFSQRFLYRIDDLILAFSEVIGKEGIRLDIEGGQLVFVVFGQRLRVIVVEDVLDEAKKEDDA